MNRQPARKERERKEGRKGRDIAAGQEMARRRSSDVDRVDRWPDECLLESSGDELGKLYSRRSCFYGDLLFS
jgi:hypothetical protein